MDSIVADVEAKVYPVGRCIPGIAHHEAGFVRELIHRDGRVIITNDHDNLSSDMWRLVRRP